MTPHCMQIHHLSFLHSSTDCSLGWLHILAIVNSTEINVGLQVFPHYVEWMDSVPLGMYSETHAWRWCRCPVSEERHKGTFLCLCVKDRCMECTWWHREISQLDHSVGRKKDLEGTRVPNHRWGGWAERKAKWWKSKQILYDSHQGGIWADTGCPNWSRTRCPCQR